MPETRSLLIEHEMPTRSGCVGNDSFSPGRETSAVQSLGCAVPKLLRV